MREILFRGKRVDNGEWVEGYYVTNPEWHRKNYREVHLVCCRESSVRYEVISETVGQYTGLIDKNGKKIFEGDIVKTSKFNTPNKKYIIKFDLQFGAFIGQDKDDMYFTTFDGDSNYFEVIGNIHDDKELLNN